MLNILIKKINNFGAVYYQKNKEDYNSYFSYNNNVVC